MAAIFQSLMNAVSSCFTWLSTILTETGLSSVVIGTIVILMFWRMIINPLFGGRFLNFKKGSDSVRKTSGSEGNE